MVGGSSAPHLTVPLCGTLRHLSEDTDKTVFLWKERGEQELSWLSARGVSSLFLCSLSYQFQADCGGASRQECEDQPRHGHLYHHESGLCRSLQPS